jgi:peptidyl-prolyl cis-trans isomerase A (cyclophilin A)
MRILSIILALGLTSAAYAQNTPQPTGSAPALAPTAKATTKAPRVEFVTNMGSFVVELDPVKAPVTVKNFLSYVNKGYYTGTIFHRVIKNFMIQGGGFTPDMVKKKTDAPIILEAKKGLSNMRGTIAMARTGNPNSATSQFFVNVVNNRNLDHMGGGYAVFGKVIKGMEVVDKIRNTATSSKGGLRDVPVETMLIKSSKVLP